MSRNYSICSWLMLAMMAAIDPCLGSTATMATASTTTKQGCPRECGNVTIPYPFGIGLDNGCSLNQYYDVFCNLSSNPNTPFLVGRGTSFASGLVQILDISETRVQVRNGGVGFMCFNSSGQITSPFLSNSYSMVLTPGSPFAFSAASTLLTVIGCQDTAIVYDHSDIFGGANTGCKSQCSSKEDVVAGVCDGFGCSQVPVPKGLRGVRVSLDNFNSNNTKVVSFNPCGYAFLGEIGRFVFGGLSDLNDPNFVHRVIETVPVAIDWVIGNETCEQALANPSSYACVQNTVCSDNSGNGIGGYKCFCRSGFQGHPYLSPGCYDIDECGDPKLNNCSMGCVNTIGSFHCTCPRGYTKDGGKNATGCIKTSSQNFVLKLGLGTSSGILVIFIGLSWLYVVDRKRKLVKMKKIFFQQNGGWLLQEQLRTVAGNQERTKIFTEEELKDATNDFDSDRILGTGGYGTVYKGILPDNKVVAIKKSKVVDQSQVEQFINELVILGQINHRNVVKLLGCCLETEVPLLVYEFIQNGTLYSHIHEQGSNWKPTWGDCVRIASEAAEAIAYLHSAASPPIIHRDIKSMNILLDDDYTARIADFGASRLIAMNRSELTTLVQGTLGYLDPEYFQSSLLTDKSDVYSFGVVLAELLTSQKPISAFRTEEDRNLATFLVGSIERDTLADVLDPQWLREASWAEIVKLASITERCLKLSGRDRPSMKQVARELEELKRLQKQPQEDQQPDEASEVDSLAEDERALYPKSSEADGY